MSARTWAILRRVQRTNAEIEACWVIKSHTQKRLTTGRLIQCLFEIIRLKSRSEKRLSGQRDEWQERAHTAEAVIRRMENERRYLAVMPQYIPTDRLAGLPEGGYVYLVRDLDVTGYYKIGRTTRPSQRITHFDVKLPFNIGVVCLIPSDACADLEAQLHRKYRHRRINGEWFNLSDDDVLNFLVRDDAITRL